MTNFWVKIFINEKLKKSFIYKLEDVYGFVSVDDFFEAITQICESIDLATPVVLSKHYNNFVKFNLTEFLPHDFVEEIAISKLVIELAKS